MKLIKIYRAALLAALGLAGLTTAQATIYNNDLMVGFSVQSGNDLMYDLGAAASLTDGQTWNLTPLLLSYNLNTVNWGVVGDIYSGGVRTSWITTDGTYTPNPVPSRTAWANIDTATATMYQFFPAAGAGQYETIATTDPTSWNQQTINGLGSFTSYISVKANPNVVGLTTATIFSQVANGSPASILGTFSLASTGVLTFNAQPVPEPAAASIIGGGALLMLVLRNKFRRQQS